VSLAWIALAAAATLADCNILESRGAAAAGECYREVALTARRASIQAEALWRAGDVAGANAAFRDAAEADPDDATARARWGRLFLDVHQQADAEALFREALSLDADNVEALLGLAELSLGRFEPGVRGYVARVFERVPDHPEAHLLLARMQLELGEVEPVRSMLERLLEKGVFHGTGILDAYALLAAADALDDKVAGPWVERALERHPGFADVHAVPAHYYVITRRYREAVDRYEKAVAVDPSSWDTHAELGINLLRVNRHDAARRHLERAYHGDPYNALTVNTLRLLDLLDGFATVREPGLLMRAPQSQAPALSPYVRDLADRARAEMASRYGYTPSDPVVVELYEHHDDFAVRTAGLPGLGILGATFGDVVVMDGPAAKGIEEGFDWVSALWHELAHVYTLGATGNRVSRWFSEGVSVMEEWDHGPTRQRSVPLHFLEAMAEDRLLGLAELDEGFLRPRYPQQVAISYIQAGLVCQLIAERFENGLADVLAAYRRGASSVAAVRRGLGVEPDELDTWFREYLDSRFGGIVAELDSFRELLREVHRAAREEDWPAALDAGRRAVSLYPDYVQPDSPYVPLARAAEAAGEEVLLDETLHGYFAGGGRDPWALSKLAERHRGAGRTNAELAVRQALVGTTPLDGALRAGFGDRLAAAGRHAEALAEYQAALSLDPHDKARAHLRLAETYLALDRAEQARRSLLEALEIAPRYGAALDLLLKMNGEH
jgi:tetratricopeptide (TPR) repeat protein